MKKFILALLLLTTCYTYSQSVFDLFNIGKRLSRSSNQYKLEKRWFSNIEAEFGVNYEVSYDFSRSDNNGNLPGGSSAKLQNKASYGILYNINYPIFNKLTVGAVGGFQYQVEQIYQH